MMQPPHGGERLHHILSIAIFVIVLACTARLPGQVTFDLTLITNGAVGSESIRADDFNLDGHLDVAVVGYFSDSVELFHGDGTGALVLSGSYPTSQTVPTRLFLASINQDGVPDMVVLHSGNRVTILTSNGVGEFATSCLFPDFAGRGVAVGDFNEDGHTDLAVTTTNSLYIFIGDGTGSFVTGGVISIDFLLGFVVTGDFDEDGHLDLFVRQYAFQQGLHAQLLLGDGTGSFEPGATVQIPQAGAPAEARDINFDGHLDVIVGGQGLSVLQGDGNGNFTLTDTVATSDGVIDIAIDDFNGDNQLDVAFALDDDNEFGVALGTGSGSFLDPVEFLTWREPTSLTCGDFDEDGNCDIVTATRWGTLGVPAALTYHAGVGDGTFPAQALVPTSFLRLLTTADFNGDGQLDLAAAKSNEVALFLGAPDGTFALSAEAPIGEDPAILHVADFDEDGTPDLLTVNISSSNLSLLLGDGNGAVSEILTVPVPEAPFGAGVGDLDEDSHLDLIVPSLLDDTITVMAGDGAGNFLAFVTLPVPLNPVAVAVDDLDADGHLDFVVASVVADLVSVFLGDGTGQGSLAASLPVDAPRHLALADLNENGDLDIVAVPNGSSPPTIFLGLGGGLFSPPNILDFTISSRPFQLLDVNGDGFLDIISPLIDDDSVAVSLGVGNGDFSERQLFAAGDGPSAVVALDLNADCRRDLVTAALYNQALIRLTNLTYADDDCNGNGLPDGCELVDGLANDCNRNGIPDSCDIAAGSSADADQNNVPDECEVFLIRGDLDGNGVLSLVDAIQLLSLLFVQGVVPCVDAADFDDSGSVSLADAVLHLGFQFGGGVPPAPPYPECGPDITADADGTDLGCSGVIPAC